MSTLDHIDGETFHGRRGNIRNAFKYTIDYVLFDAEAELDTPALFSRNGRNVASVSDLDHGGEIGKGRGAAWVREVLANYRVKAEGPIQLLTQPKVLGHVFNPVSFWLCYDGPERLMAVIAEVNNTFGDRHSYLCLANDRAPITGLTRIKTQKIFHVSPFQPVEGEYTFRFDIQPEAINIQIQYGREAGGLVATLSGPRKPLATGQILKSLARRPFGSRRVLALIHWQALVLWFKRATYRARPTPPVDEVSK